MAGIARGAAHDARLRHGDQPATFSCSVDGTTMTIDGQQVINVKDFGIDPPRLIILKVEPDVDLQVHIVAELQP